jgi:hypothetical protein
MSIFACTRNKFLNTVSYEWQQIAVTYRGHAVQGTVFLRSIAGMVGSNPTVYIPVQVETLALADPSPVLFCLPSTTSDVNSDLEETREFYP